MSNIIKEHLSKYGFVEIPCSIPKNKFQYFKRFIYIRIYEKSPKLFYFLRDKISPIKFLSERPDGSLWFSIRGEDGKELFSLSIEKWGTENKEGKFIQTDYSIGIGECNNLLRETFTRSENILVSINENPIPKIDELLQTFPELKYKYRNYRLNQIC